MIAVRPGTQAGTQVRIARQGVPRGPRSPGGDMFVIVSVAIPRTVTERQRQLLQVRLGLQAPDGEGLYVSTCRPCGVWGCLPQSAWCSKIVRVLMMKAPARILCGA